MLSPQIGIGRGGGGGGGRGAGGCDGGRIAREAQ